MTSVCFGARWLTLGIVLALAGWVAADAPSVLDQRVGTFDCGAQSVASTVNAMAHERGIAIIVDWSSLPVQRDARPAIQLGGCRLRDALGTIFPNAEIFSDPDGIHVKGNSAAPISLKVYPVADLVRALGWNGADELSMLVERMVRSDSWIDSGGKCGLRMQGVAMMAQQTAAGHEQIENLLGLLRSAIVEKNRPQEPDARFAPTSMWNRKLPDMRFRNTPLGRALTDLQAAAHFGMIAHWDWLEAAGVDKDTPVTVDLSGLKVAEALDFVCGMLGIICLRHDGIAEVLPRDQVGQSVESRVFDVAPLVEVVKSDVAGSGAKVNPEGVAESFGTMIEQLVECDSWKNNGGSVGVIQTAANCVVVTNSSRAHEQIAALMSGIQAASDPATQPGRKDPEPPDPLATRLVDMDLDTNLGRAMEILSERSQAQILVDWKALEAVGVDRNAPIKVRIYAGSLAKALTVVLDLAGPEQSPLGFRKDDVGIVHVSTAENAAREGVTKMYNIRDLIDRFINEMPAGAQNGALRQLQARSDAVDMITKMIEDMVATDSWKDNGGSVGALREFAGLLIVTNTAENQTKVKQLLETLRTQLTIGNAARNE